MEILRMTPRRRCWAPEVAGRHANVPVSREYMVNANPKLCKGVNARFIQIATRAHTVKFAGSVVIVDGPVEQKANPRVTRVQNERRRTGWIKMPHTTEVNRPQWDAQHDR